MSGYCRSCYRDLPAERTRCADCSQREGMRPLSRATMLVGLAGVPLLIGGLLGFDARACLAGAALSGVAVLVHIATTLRCERCPIREEGTRSL